MIARIPGLSCKVRVELIETFDREEDIAVCSKGDIERIAGKPLEALAWDALRFQAEEDLRAASRAGMAFVSFRDAGYPPLLRELYDPPALLFYRGALPNPEKPVAAIVGTRRPSSSAVMQAFGMARNLGLAGVPVISGLALGIDAFAHRGNLDGGGATVAVLGSGLDWVYPASNRGLARSILDGGGALVSEYPPGTRPAKWRFPARNRIIAGLARAVVIVEAPEKSGALITADFALQLGRDLFVGSAGTASRKGGGCRALAADGAEVIAGVEGILREWGLEAREPENPAADGPGLAASLERELGR
jgi:DNA processing protein